MARKIKAIAAPESMPEIEVSQALDAIRKIELRGNELSARVVNLQEQISELEQTMEKKMEELRKLEEKIRDARFSYGEEAKAMRARLEENARMKYSRIVLEFEEWFWAKVHDKFKDEISDGVFFNMGIKDVIEWIIQSERQLRRLLPPWLQSLAGRDVLRNRAGFATEEQPAVREEGKEDA